MTEQAATEWDIELTKANTRSAIATAVKTEHEVELAQARDASRLYHFSTGVTDRSVEVCIEVLTRWMYRSNEPITLAFSSPGGGIFSGFALYDYVRETISDGQQIDTTVFGYAASMAGVLLQAGSVRTMRPNSYLMIHEASTMMGDSLSALRDQMELLEAMQARVITIMASRANVDEDFITEKTRRKDWWLTADEALEYGFIDAITA